MIIPTEPIGSIPRPPELIEAVAAGNILDPNLDPHFEDAIKDTVERFEETGSPIITDGEQRKFHNFWTYSVFGLPNTAPDGFKIPFAAGHVRRMPRLTEGPFRYKRYAYQYLDVALKYASRPLKQAVISPSALSLMYPADAIPGYSRDEFIEDLLTEHEKEVRGCLAKGAAKVQIDFTEARFAMKVDPTGELLAPSSTSTTSPWPGSPRPKGNALECTPARVVISIRRTARKSITPNSCRCSSS